MQRVDQKIADRNGQLNQQGGSVSSSFAVVTLSQGQTLTGDILCHHIFLHMAHTLAKPLFVQGPHLLQQDHGIPAQAAALVHGEVDMCGQPGLPGAALMSGVSLAAEAGSPQDPLVTLSYLNDTFFSQIRRKELPPGGNLKPTGRGAARS